MTTPAETRLHLGHRQQRALGLQFDGEGRRKIENSTSAYGAIDDHSFVVCQSRSRYEFGISRQQQTESRERLLDTLQEIA